MRNERQGWSDRLTLFALAVSACLGASAAQADPIAFTFTGGSTHGFFGASFTAGYTFTVDSPILITALGVWDTSPGTPLGRPHPVGVWNAGGTLLASNTVLTNSPLTNDFRFVALSTPLPVTPGQTYTIGAFYPNTGTDAATDQPLQSSATGFVQAPGMAFGQDEFVFNNAGLSQPTFNAVLGFADFGPNFEFAAIPEPPMLLPFGAAGLIVLSILRGRRRLTRDCADPAGGVSRAAGPGAIVTCASGPASGDPPLVRVMKPTTRVAGDRTPRRKWRHNREPRKSGRSS